MGSACYRASEAYVLGALPRSKLTGVPPAIAATELVSVARDVREQPLRQTAAAAAVAGAPPADREDDVEATPWVRTPPKETPPVGTPRTKNMSNFADPTSAIPMAIPYVTDMVVPQLTTPAPDFCGTALVYGQFKEIKLSDYKNNTFVCPTEIIAFSDRVEEFRRVNCEVVACSTDSHFCHLAWTNIPRNQGGVGQVNIPLLADKTMKIARAYGVLNEDEGIAFRALFIIDKQVRLRQVTINDVGVGRSVDEALRLVQAFQYVDEHGEVCPANWKPGSDSIRPDPSGSKAYFAKH
ncbi:peroxiredoxin 2-like isoform X2 [Haemaphysalis longicornis]